MGSYRVILRDLRILRVLCGRAQQDHAAFLTVSIRCTASDTGA